MERLSDEELDMLIDLNQDKKQKEEVKKLEEVLVEKYGKEQIYG